MTRPGRSGAPARDGAVWVCVACGKTTEDRYAFTDASCFLNAVECSEDSVRLDESGRVVAAEAVSA